MTSIESNNIPVNSQQFPFSSNVQIPPGRFTRCLATMNVCLTKLITSISNLTKNIFSWMLSYLFQKVELINPEFMKAEVINTLLHQKIDDSQKAYAINNVEYIIPIDFFKDLINRPFPFYIENTFFQSNNIVKRDGTTLYFVKELFNRSAACAETFAISDAEKAIAKQNIFF